ncbi:hypothetical protein EMPS_08782 [Entomortierella parvispora]|uniref:Alcohol dehydrogenase-like C-terminal domain-containing protein n=1 Tax=Entomortierella parvispora TaxID=205924 RepID=A0A9P3HH12_9FUNG|nr:hypothetical protein EMPS_08782 [Entomortierella parvispora]
MIIAESLVLGWVEMKAPKTKVLQRRDGEDEEEEEDSDKKKDSRDQHKHLEEHEQEDDHSAERKRKEEEEAKGKEEADRQRVKEKEEAKAKEEQERQKDKEEEERKEREQQEAKEREEKEREAKDKAEREAREEAERKAREEADLKAKEEAERKAREEADAKAKEEAERKAREEADAKAKEEADAKAKEETDLNAKEESDLKAKEEADKKAAEEEAAHKAKEEEAKIRDQSEADERARKEAEEKKNEREKNEKTEQEERDRQAQKDADKDNKDNQGHNDKGKDEESTLDGNEVLKEKSEDSNSKRTVLVVASTAGCAVLAAIIFGLVFRHKRQARKKSSALNRYLNRTVELHPMYGQSSHSSFGGYRSNGEETDLATWSASQPSQHQQSSQKLAHDDLHSNWNGPMPSSMPSLLPVDRQHYPGHDDVDERMGHEMVQYGHFYPQQPPFMTYDPQHQYHDAYQQQYHQHHYYPEDSYDTYGQEFNDNEQHHSQLRTGPVLTAALTVTNNPGQPSSYFISTSPEPAAVATLSPPPREAGLLPIFTADLPQAEAAPSSSSPAQDKPRVIRSPEAIVEREAEKGTFVVRMGRDSRGIHPPNINIIAQDNDNTDSRSGVYPLPLNRHEFKANPGLRTTFKPASVSALIASELTYSPPVRSAAGDEESGTLPRQGSPSEELSSPKTSRYGSFNYHYQGRRFQRPQAHAFLTITEIPIREPTSGEAVVEILAARVLSYASEIFDGSRPYPNLLPLVPGAGGIGIIRSIGPGNTTLQTGQMVVIDPTIRARDNAISPDIMLHGLIAYGPGPQSLQSVWNHGTWAEKSIIPVENLNKQFAVPPSLQTKYTSAQLTTIGTFAVVYGGLLSADFKAGQTIAITGATGPFGSSAVAVALAMGARRVIASGRNAAVLESLVAKLGPRVFPLVATADETLDTANFRKAAGEGFQIDVTFDILPPTAPFSTARAAIGALRFGGTAVLMGGVQSNVELPYPVIMSNNLTIKGNFMYTRAANVNLLGMLDSGLLDPTLVQGTSFKLDQADEAVQWSKNHAGPFEATLLTPN